MALGNNNQSGKLVVVPYRPYQRAALIGATVAGLVLTAVISFGVGHHRATAIQSGAATTPQQEPEDWQQKLEEKNRELKSLSQQVANLELAREVDQASNEGVRQEVISLKSEIARLEEDIKFYRGLMAPTDNQGGLTIGAVDVLSTGVPRQYDFKIVMQQLATNHQLLNGTLSVNIVGHDNGIARVIPLKELSEQVADTDIKLRFKYFQNITGQLQLPAGFEPERIEVQARSTGKNAARAEKKFGWLVQES